MALRYITKEEFLNGQKGLKIEVGPDKCFQNNDDLEFFLCAIEEMIDNYLGRRLDQTNHIYTFMGSRRSTLFTRNYPINSVSSITFTYVGNTNPPETIEEDKYLVTDNSIIYPSTFQNRYYYTVTYNAGWLRENIPTVIKQGIIEQAALTLQEHQRGILESESYLNSKLLFTMTQLPLYPQIQQKLEPYKSRNMLL